MDEALVSGYWCHQCSQMVSPIMELEIKCPNCNSGFVEEMEGRGENTTDAASNLGSDRALSLWAPILLGMMDNTPRRWRFRQGEEEGEEDQDGDQDHNFTSVLRRRRRSTALLQLLSGLQEGIQPESGNPEREMERDRERVILINPFNQAIILQGSFDPNQTRNQGGNNTGTGASLGDYFVGPGLELLLQHLAENDQNRYGTPPAQKEAVEAMPTVKIEENISCSICLEDFDIGAEAREMPCKHKFHGGCILPWLELHSSCPVCRFQMPADGSKVSNEGEGGNGGRREEGSGGDRGDGGSGGNGRRFWIPVPWPFNGLFSFSGSQGSANGNSSSTTPSSSSSSGSNSSSQSTEH